MDDLEEQLEIARANAAHYKKMWQHFREKVKSKGLWNGLMGLDDEQGQPALPQANSSSMQKDLTPDEAIEQQTRFEVVESERKRATQLLEELQQRFTEQSAKLVAATEEAVLDHPLHKAALQAYTAEKQQCQRIMQQLQQAKEESQLREGHLKTEKSRIEQQENKKRMRLEEEVYQMDLRLQQKEKQIHEASAQQAQGVVLQQETDALRAHLQEQTVLLESLQNELAQVNKRLSNQETEDDFEKEFESVSKAYEDMAQQNTKLMQLLQDKDKAITQLNTEKVKQQQALALLKQAQLLHAEVTQKNNKLRLKQEEWITKLTQCLESMQAIETRLQRENATLTIANAHLSQEVTAGKMKAEELTQQLHTSRAECDIFRTNSQDLAQQLSAKSEEAVQLLAKAEAAKQKLERVKRGETKVQRSESESSRALEAEVAALRVFLLALSALHH
eukprot:TRINITY_DN57174_c0_g1_i1.p1 TRINITY_DN57174_c0_g1~~TRINITY_DN57174_c0_g1_i1.p1  ORF type:complete len:447 (-),score=129.13 TRINITY_DN57174_c0_g1_i1:188-1528(-)